MKNSGFISIIIFISLIFKLFIPARAQYADHIQVVLENTRPIDYDLGNRLPLILWPLIDPGPLTTDQAKDLVTELDARGIALISRWTRDNRQEALEQALIIGQAQNSRGSRIYINAIDLLYSFFNGDEHTAHIDAEGKHFWDDSFGAKKDMGCPFAIDFRKNEIRERIEFYLDEYIRNNLEVDLIFVDWEVDGPLEVNRAFEASGKCIRCTKHLGPEVDFMTFQRRMREMRSYLKYYTLSEPVLSRFPDALVGNYAVYPHDGYRYWYDYFEFYVEGQPAKQDQEAKYREWYHDFPLTGFTFAMPVSYTWARTFEWYDFENTDYRWFYNMLLVASNAGKSTPHSIPVVTWVHWHTIFYPGEPDGTIKQFSEERYQELLWHMLLRRTSTLAMWCEPEENEQEIRLIHEVYAAAQAYGEFLDEGLPINFEVPSEPGTVISGLILEGKVLVRRTDFAENTAPVTIMAGTTPISVPYAPGKCQVISLK
jgi:hypothetical protein